MPAHRKRTTPTDLARWLRDWFGSYWSGLTDGDRAWAAALAVVIVGALGAAVYSSNWWVWVVSALVVSQCAFDLLHIGWVKARRVAHVRCANGVVHRFTYGPNGWVEDGQSTEVFPDATPALST